jgi:hypothetical protein
MYGLQIVQHKFEEMPSKTACEVSLFPGVLERLVQAALVGGGLQHRHMEAASSPSASPFLQGLLRAAQHDRYVQQADSISINHAMPCHVVLVFLLPILSMYRSILSISHVALTPFYHLSFSSCLLSVSTPLSPSLFLLLSRVRLYAVPATMRMLVFQLLLPCRCVAASLSLNCRFPVLQCSDAASGSSSPGSSCWNIRQ